MSIEFICPVKGVSNNFPDAYAGVKFRCKHCSEFHTLPQSENYVHKDILSACPNTDEVVSIDSSLKTNRFLCASCGQVHEVPGEESANSNYTEIASSTKYQNQARQKIIPSVRKRSLLADEENPNAKIGSRTNTPAVNFTDLKNDKKIGSRTNLPTVPITEKKQKAQTERKRTSLNNEDNYDQSLRKPYTRPKKKFSFLNFFLVLFFLGVIGGLVYIFLKSEKATSNLGDLNTKIQQAENEANAGNFEKAISISDEILSSIQASDMVKERVNIKDIENKNKKYKNQNTTFKKIDDKVTKILNNPLLNGSGIEKCLDLLIEEKNSLPNDINFNKPIFTAVDSIKLKLKTKQFNFVKTSIEKLIKLSDAEYQQGNLQEYNNKIQDIYKNISKLDGDLQNDLKTEFSVKFKEFENNQATASNINTIFQKSLTAPLLINELINELKAIDSNTNVKDIAIKNLIDQKLNLLKESKKIGEIKRLDGLLRDKDRVKKDLQEFLLQLSPSEGNVKIELAKHLSRVIAKIHEVSTFQSTDLVNLKFIATLIGQTLNETQEPLLMKIDADKNSISWQDENVKSYAGYNLIDEKMHFIIDMNGLKIAFEKTFFEKNRQYLIRYAKSLHDSMVLTVDENIFSTTPWVVTEEILQIGAPAAFLKTTTETKLFLYDKTYKINEMKPLFKDEQVIKQDITNQINKVKSILLNSNEGLEVKTNLNLCLFNMTPAESSSLISFNPNVNWLLDNDFDKFLTDPTCIKAIRELKTYWEKTYFSQSAWLEGTTENKTTLELFRIFGNRVNGRIYNPEKIETTFIQTTAENFSAKYNDLTLNYSFHNIYQGNQKTLPEIAPIRIFTIHPLGGVISVFNNISNKLEVNISYWSKTFDSSKLFGKMGETKTSLAPHSLRIDKNGLVKEIYFINFMLDVGDKIASDAQSFSKWVEENKNNFNNPEKINLLLLFCSKNFDQGEILNILINTQTPNKLNISIKNSKVTGDNRSIPYLISTFIANTLKPNVILNLKSETRNVWLENQDGNQFLCYYKNNFINRAELQDFTRDFRACLQNNDQEYYSQYKLPVTVYNKDQSRWLNSNIPCLLISDLIIEENRNNLIKAAFTSSSTRYEDILTNSLMTTLKEIDLFDYIADESQFSMQLASQKFSRGVKLIKKEATISAKLEQLRLKLLDNKEKNAVKDFDEIFDTVITSDQFKKEPNKILDVRYYLAKELVKNGKFAMAKSLLYTNNPNKILTLEEIFVYADICFSRFLIFEKDKALATDYKSDITPIQEALENSFNEIYEKSVLDIKSILKLNLAWVKLQASKDRVDLCDQQLLIPVTNETKKLPITGKEQSDCQWNWARQNPLCYQLIIQKILNDIDLEKEVETKQRLNISAKLIQAMMRNCSGEDSVWKNHPYQAIVISYSTSNDFIEKKWQALAEKIAQLSNLNYSDIEYFNFLAINTQTLTYNELNELLKNCAKLDISNDFYKNYFQNLLRFKFIKKSRDTLAILKEVLPNRKDLIQDLEKSFSQ